jgi:hypothetical protein
LRLRPRSSSSSASHGRLLDQRPAEQVVHRWLFDQRAGDGIEQ